jgi:hypothetical protein
MRLRGATERPEPDLVEPHSSVVEPEHEAKHGRTQMQGNTRYSRPGGPAPLPPLSAQARGPDIPRGGSEPLHIPFIAPSLDASLVDAPFRTVPQVTGFLACGPQQVEE